MVKINHTEIRNRAETELLKFKDNDFLWCKNILGQTLRPHQEVYCKELDAHDDCLLIGARRINKSWTIAYKFLKWTTSDYAGMKANCFAPALAQSRRNLKYMADMVMGSPILTAFIDRRMGKKGIGSEYINFLNGSEIKAKGQASSTDGLGSHAIWGDEFDDMNMAVWNERILGTGAENPEYLGLKSTKVIRTGTIKGKGNIWKCENDPDMKEVIHVLPKIDCYVGIELGIISEKYIRQMRKVLTKAQFQRMFLVEYTESNNFYKTRDLNACSTFAIVPLPIRVGQTFERPNLNMKIGLGFDSAGKSALATRDNDGRKSKRATRANYAVSVVAEIKPNIYQLLYCKEWDKTTKSSAVERELYDIWNYFRPDKGYGDAYNSDLIIRVNKMLYKNGIIKQNPDKFNDGPGLKGWDGMTFSPFRFDGPTKHNLHLTSQKIIEDRRIFFPKVIADSPRYAYLDILMKQFENVRSRPTTFQYDTYYCETSLLGDDIVESFIAGIYALENCKSSLIIKSAGNYIGSFIGAGKFRTPAIIRK